MSRIAALLALVVTPTLVFATPTILVDDFSGSTATPTASIWQSIGNSPLPNQSGGYANFTTRNRFVEAMRSVQSFSYGTFRIEFTAQGGGIGHVLGLNSQTDFSSFAAEDAAYYRDDGGNFVYSGGVPVGSPPTSFYQMPSAAVIEIVWTPTLLRITENGALFAETALNIPSKPLYLEFTTYRLADALPFISIDRVTYTPYSVPEPSSQQLLFMSFVALAAMTTKRRREAQPLAQAGR